MGKQGEPNYKGNGIPIPRVCVSEHQRHRLQGITEPSSPAIAMVADAIRIRAEHGFSDCSWMKCPAFQGLLGAWGPCCARHNWCENPCVSGIKKICDKLVEFNQTNDCLAGLCPQRPDPSLRLMESKVKVNVSKTAIC